MKKKLAARPRTLATVIDMASGASLAFAPAVKLAAIRPGSGRTVEIRIWILHAHLVFFALVERVDPFRLALIQHGHQHVVVLRLGRSLNPDLAEVTEPFADRQSFNAAPPRRLTAMPG